MSGGSAGIAAKSDSVPRRKRKVAIVVAVPKVASQWHPTKNWPLRPEQVTCGSGRKVWWQCEDGHAWPAIIANRVRGSGCPYCAGQRVTEDTCLERTHPRLATEWHKTNNGNLKPNECTSGSHRKVWWQCAKAVEHAWQATIAHRTQGQGCPFCAGRRASIANSVAGTHPELATEWHPTRNVSVTPNQFTSNSHRQVWWRCRQGHEWQAVISSRTRGNGCPRCGRGSGRYATTENCLARTHPDLVKQWHATRNSELAPSQVTASSHKSVWWRCSQGSDHEWEAPIRARVRGNECPFCSGHRVSSTTCLTHRRRRSARSPSSRDRAPRHWSVGRVIL